MKPYRWRMCWLTVQILDERGKITIFSQTLWNHLLKSLFDQFFFIFVFAIEIEPIYLQNRFLRKVTCIWKQAKNSNLIHFLYFYCTCLRYQISKLLGKQERNLPKKNRISFEKSRSRVTIEKDSDENCISWYIYVCLNK